VVLGSEADRGTGYVNNAVDDDAGLHVHVGELRHLRRKPLSRLCSVCGWHPVALTLSPPSCFSVATWGRTEQEEKKHQCNDRGPAAQPSRTPPRPTATELPPHGAAMTTMNLPRPNPVHAARGHETRHHHRS
jgi:hypothetical protein